VFYLLWFLGDLYVQCFPARTDNGFVHEDLRFHEQLRSYEVMRYEATKLRYLRWNEFPCFSISFFFVSSFLVRNTSMHACCITTIHFFCKGRSWSPTYLVIGRGRVLTFITFLHRA
jgi:hypothetical protein